MSKCKGCGVLLQYEDKSKLGYTPKKDSKLCQRCFKITNYNEHVQIIDKIDNKDIIKGINGQKCATLFLCDILNLNNHVINDFKQINNPKCLVITKSDIIPKNIKLDLLAQRIMNEYHIEEIIFVSTLNGEGKKDVLAYLKEHQKVVLAGPTSSGKSSLINYLFNLKLTVSNRKNTTQEFIKIKTDDGTIIDAPGFNEEYLNDTLKQSGYINPKTVILKKGYLMQIGNFSFACNEDTSLTLFFPKEVTIITKKLKKNLSKNIEIKKISDLIIDNIGFVYFKNSCLVSYEGEKYLDVRSSIVGGVHE